MSSPQTEFSVTNVCDTPKPLVSVLVVTYNQEDTLGRTIDSLLAQDLEEPWEILICDDASADGTAGVARRYADAYPDRIRLIVRDRNLGVQGNYFDGVRRCRADLIADCAGDDFWCDPTKLRRQLEHIREHPEVSLVHTGWSYLRPDGTTSLHIQAPEYSAPVTPGRKILQALISREQAVIIHLCTALYRKSPVIEALERYPELMLNPSFLVEDLQIMAFEAAAGDIAYIPDDTLRYSVGHDSISTPKSMNKEFDFALATFLLREALARHFSLPDGAMKPYRRTMIPFIASRAYRGGSAERMSRLFMELHRLGLRATLKTRLYSLLLKLKNLKSR